jgi:hypothetical protein
MSQHYTAKARLENQTGAEITQVRLSHTYDNDYVDSMQWEHLANGAASSELTWNFNAGFGCTGDNYWRISFVADGRKWYTPGSGTIATPVSGYWGICTKRDGSESGKLHTWKISKRGDKMVVCGEFHCGKVELVLSSCAVPRTDARPVYVLAHRCNGWYSPAMAMYAGANGVEFDIQYYKNEYIVLHDGTLEHKLFNVAEKLSTWLEHARKAAEMFEGQFAVMLFDLKVACDADKAAAVKHIKNIQTMAREKMGEGRHRPRFIFSISSLDNKVVFKEIIKDLRPDEGISIDEGQSPDDVQKYYRESGITNGWYGDGIFVGGDVPLDPFGGVASRKDRLLKAVALRDAGKAAGDAQAIKKVYYWTVSNKGTIKDALGSMGLDGILVNTPKAIAATVSTTFGMLEAEEVLAESNGTLRLATLSDNPFA